MLALLLFGLALVLTAVQLTFKAEWNKVKMVEVLLSYLLLFSLGVMGILAAYAHLFMGAEVAQQIGWPAGSPFQFEVGMANLAFGVLGVLSFWYRGNFWGATIFGWSVFVLGCFIGHVMDFILRGNVAPYNIGFFIWFYDLFLPFLLLGLYQCYLKLLAKREEKE